MVIECTRELYDLAAKEDCKNIPLNFGVVFQFRARQADH